MVLVPLVLLFFSPFSASVWRQILTRYDVRWHHDYDGEGRVQTITLRNNGYEAVPHVLVKLKVRCPAAGPADGPVADVAFARSGRPRWSFVESIPVGEAATAWGAARPNGEAATNPAPEGEGNIKAVMDEHSDKRSLYGLDRALDTLLADEMKTSRALRSVADDLEKAAPSCSAWHKTLLQGCKNHLYSEEACRRAGEVVQSWEIFKKDLREKSRERWFAATGVRMEHDDRPDSAEEEMNFTLGLGAQESAVLQVNYNPSPSLNVDTEAHVSSGWVGRTNRVENTSDLGAPLFLFLLRYDLWVAAVAFLAVVCGLAFAWPEVRPKKLLPIHKVFKTALATDDHEYWEHAYQRHRFYILQQFRILRKDYERRDLNPDPEFILDYVRSELIKAHYAGGDRWRVFRSEQKLNLFIRTQLKSLVLIPS